MESSKFVRLSLVQCCLTFVVVWTKPMASGWEQVTMNLLESVLTKNSDHSQGRMLLEKALDTWKALQDSQSVTASPLSSYYLTTPPTLPDDSPQSRQLSPTSYLPWSWFSSSNDDEDEEQEGEEEQSLFRQVMSVLGDDVTKRLLKELAIMFMGPTRRSHRHTEPKDIFIFNDDTMPTITQQKSTTTSYTTTQAPAVTTEVIQKLTTLAAEHFGKMSDVSTERLQTVTDASTNPTISTDASRKSVEEEASTKPTTTNSRSAAATSSPETGWFDRVFWGKNSNYEESSYIGFDPSYHGMELPSDYIMAEPR